MFKLVCILVLACLVGLIVSNPQNIIRKYACKSNEHCVKKAAQSKIPIGKSCNNFTVSLNSDNLLQRKVAYKICTCKNGHLNATDCNSNSVTFGKGDQCTNVNVNVKVK